MDEWVKIESFERLHQAELRKDILEQHNIQAVIINAQDSLFLLGEIELYVQKEDKAKAIELISEFQGLAKVNSFVNKRPMELFTDLLAQNGIQAVLKQKEDTSFVLDNYEVYVPNEEVQKTIPFLLGEKMVGWQKIVTTKSVSQAKFRVDLLEENQIDAIVIKQRNTNFHTEEVHIYTRLASATEADNLLSNLNGWITIQTFDELHKAEIREDLLKERNIKAIIFPTPENGFELLVEAHNEEEAIDQINTYSEWIRIAVYEHEMDAEYAKEILKEKGINATTINRKDSAFMLGGVELYVDNLYLEESLQTIEELI